MEAGDGYIVVQLAARPWRPCSCGGSPGTSSISGRRCRVLVYGNWQALLDRRVVLTALLVSVILGTASAAQNVGAIAALGVGGYIALAFS